MDKIKKIFRRYGIDTVGYVCKESFDLLYPHLLPKQDIAGALVFLSPYKYSPAYADKANISKYARAYDYHIFAKQFYASIIPKLQAEYPSNCFLGFCDSSPINEKLAAAKAGLGIIGRNSLLINDVYGSYCFIGSLFTDYLPIHNEYPISYCEQCMKCVKSCPVQALEQNYPDSTKCLSAVSQKKKRTAGDFAVLRENAVVWGCDICQDVCPHNANVSDTKIEFFKTSLITDLTYNKVKDMSDEEFAKRAFAWRGRRIILENLSNLSEDQHLSID